jgi:serine phosphatase RsbU (regulator of sigma subunit)
LLLLVTILEGQEDFLFENISVAEGLSTAQLNVDQTIRQDCYGFMWFATVEGLNRYDGYSFKVYKNIPNDTTSLPSGNVNITASLVDTSELQLSMLPEKLPQFPNLDIAVYMQTATEVGGDYYDFPYELREQEIYSGDTILLMSDGLPELMNPQKEQFGYKRTRNLYEEVAERSPEGIIDALKKSGSNWVNGKDPDDDVTFVIIKVK